MPEEVQDDIGYALDLAQHNQQADYAEQMKGELRDVIEIRADDETGNSTFRAAYTVKLGDNQRLKQAREYNEQQRQKSRD